MGSGTSVGVLASLIDLVLPTECGGCGVPGAGAVCAGCAARLAADPTWVAPTPPPPGMPPCLAVGVYEGPLRELILAYKERGRRDLTRPLGDALATAVAAGLVGHPAPVVLVPVPDTAPAARTRHGDHMLRLARHAARRLRGQGRQAAVVAALRALPKDDSTHLDRYERAVAARSAFQPRPGIRALVHTRATVIVVDDVLTTGATVAAVAQRLRDAGVEVAFAATVAATRLRHAPGGGPNGPFAPEDVPIGDDLTADTSYRHQHG